MTKLRVHSPFSKEPCWIAGFVGIGPIRETEVRRDLLFFDIRVTDSSVPAEQSSAPSQGPAGPLKF